MVDKIVDNKAMEEVGITKSHTMESSGFNFPA